MIDPGDIPAHVAQLNSSDDPRALVYSAQSVARGRDADAHGHLLTLLSRTEFLNRLDPPADVLRLPPRRLRVYRVLRALTREPAESRHAVLAGLTSSSDFLARRARVDLLIVACAEVRPSPPEVIRYWDHYCQAKDGHCNVTACALLDNGSEPAIRLFEQKLADPKHDHDDKMVWLRRFVIPKRNEPLVLDAAYRLLRSDLSGDLRAHLVAVLFDHQPRAWSFPYGCGRPPLDTATPAAEQKRRRIAEYALAEVTLSERTRVIVQSYVDRADT